MFNRRKKYKLGDWLVQDDITGLWRYASEMELLEVETGYGGSYMESSKAFTIDYGLVPYIPPTEEPTPYARPKNEVITDTTTLINVETTDPMSST